MASIRNQTSVSSQASLMLTFLLILFACSFSVFNVVVTYPASYNVTVIFDTSPRQPIANAHFDNNDMYYITSSALYQNDSSNPVATTPFSFYDPQYETVRNETVTLVAHHSGWLYITDTRNNCIRKFNTTTNAVVDVAGVCGSTASFQDGAALQARFFHPRGLAFGPDDSIYISDTMNHRIRKINSAQDTVSTFSGTGQSYYADGAAHEAMYARPNGIAYMPHAQTFYVGDYDYGYVRSVNLTGYVFTSFFQDCGGVLFNTASALTVIGEYVLFVDTRPSSSYVCAFPHSDPAAAVQVIPLSTTLSYPRAISVAPDGTIEISDTGNNRIISLDACLYYADVDGDGYGNVLSSVWASCSTPMPGYTRVAGDCDDSKSTVHEGAVEICDLLDNNCEGRVDEGFTGNNTFYYDGDGDGYGNETVTLTTCATSTDGTPFSNYKLLPFDCDDSDPSVHPGGTEVCNNRDDNCNQIVDENFDLNTYYVDKDDDGYGNATDSIQTCFESAPIGFSSNPDDCDDSNPNIRKCVQGSETAAASSLASSVDTSSQPIVSNSSHAGQVAGGNLNPNHITAIIIAVCVIVTILVVVITFGIIVGFSIGLRIYLRNQRQKEDQLELEQQQQSDNFSQTPETSLSSSSSSIRSSLPHTNNVEVVVAARTEAADMLSERNNSPGNRSTILAGEADGQSASPSSRRTTAQNPQASPTAARNKHFDEMRASPSAKPKAVVNLMLEEGVPSRMQVPTRRATTVGRGTGTGMDPMGSTGTSTGSSPDSPRSPLTPRRRDSVLYLNQRNETGWEVKNSDIKIISKLGQGAFGTVYKAELHGDIVAVKRFDFGDADEDQQRKMITEFQNEVQLLLVLRHPNILGFRGAVIEWPNVAIVTELMEDGSLFDWLYKSAKYKLSYRQKLTLMKQMAKGIEYLHRKKIIHRDLKSQNILLTGAGGAGDAKDPSAVVRGSAIADKLQAKIGDFGLSKLKHGGIHGNGDGTTTFKAIHTQQVGTALWMAPEVTTGEHYTTTCDIYSLGIIMNEMLTEKLPYYQEKKKNNIHIRAAMDPEFRPAIEPMNYGNGVDYAEVDRRFVALMKRCWMHEPHERPAMADVIQELGELAQLVVSIEDRHFNRSSVAPAGSSNKYSGRQDESEEEEEEEEDEINSEEEEENEDGSTVAVDHHHHHHDGHKDGDSDGNGGEEAKAKVEEQVQKKKIMQEEKADENQGATEEGEGEAASQQQQQQQEQGQKEHRVVARSSMAENEKLQNRII